MSATTQNLVDVGFNARRSEAIETAITGAVGAITAADIPFTPAGTVAATDVQAAIAEVDSEKVPTTRTITSGNGLTGGGDLSLDRTLAVGAGTGLTVAADAIGLSDMAEATIKGRAAGAGTGAPADLSASQVRSITTQAADYVTAAAISGGATEVDIALGSYDMVEIDLIALEPSDDSALLQARFSQDGGSNYLSGASDYGWGLIFSNNISSDAADTEIQISDAVGNAAGERATVTVRIFRPAASSFTKTCTWYGWHLNGSTVNGNLNGGGHLIANTDAITHVRFFWSAGTFDVGYYAARGYRFA